MLPRAALPFAMSRYYAADIFDFRRRLIGFIFALRFR